MAVWFAASVFIGLILAASLFTLAVSGHFPREFRSHALGGVVGSSIIFATTTVTFGATVVGATVGWQHIPGFVMVIGGGASILMAPLVLAWASDRFVNGPAALLLLSVTSALLAIVLYFWTW